MSSEELFVVEPTALDKMLAEVADDAYESVIETWNELLAEALSYATYDDPDGADKYLEESSMYIYVYKNGTWIIDAPDYLQDHRNIVAHAAVCAYANSDTLRYELEASTF